jgi:hypothetical protein
MGGRNINQNNDSSKKKNFKKIASPLWFLYSARRRDLVRIKKKEIDQRKK